jgi:hypothetical protein
MPTVTPPQAIAVLQTLAFFQALARPDGPAFEPMLAVNWERSAGAIGLRGNPENPWNSLVRHSRLLQATSPTGETCLGLLLLHQPDHNAGELYLAPRCLSLHATFRLEMPAVFRAYRHCTDPLAEDEFTFLRAHALDGQGRVQTRGFVRLRDLWKSGDAAVDHDRARDLAARPAEMAALGALRVTRAFDASDLRWAPSPWARFLLRTDGLEGAVAARDLGMQWIAAEEDPAAPPGGVFSHGPL